MKNMFLHIGKSMMSLMLAILILISGIVVGYVDTANAEITAGTDLELNDSDKSVAAYDNDTGFADDVKVLSNSKKAEKKLSESSGGNDKTYDIYFKNTLNWSKVGVWAWSGDSANFTGGSNKWPGYEMTYVSSGDYAGLYKRTLTINSDYTTVSFIFNNNLKSGASQTQEFKIEEFGDLYNNSIFIAGQGTNSSGHYAITRVNLECYKETKTTVDSYNIYFKNTNSWSSVSAYYWNYYDNSQSEVFFGAITSPVSLTKTNDDLVYKLTLNKDINYIKFRDGSSGSNKTDDLPFSLSYKGKMYDYSTKTWLDYTESENNDDDDEDAPEYNIYFVKPSSWTNAGVKAYSGSHSFTGVSNIGNQMTEVTSGSYNGLYKATLKINPKYTTINFIFNNYSSGTTYITETFVIEQFGEEYNNSIFVSGSGTTDIAVTRVDLECYNKTKTTVDPYNIYFKNTDSWNDVYGHYWNFYGTNANGEDTFFNSTTYPGISMSKIGDTDVYKLNLNKDIDYIQFRSGGSGATKTSNLPFALSYKGKMYNYSTGVWEDYTEPEDIPTPTVTYDWYIGGRFSANGKSTSSENDTGWNRNSNLFKFEKVSDGKYKYETNETIDSLSSEMNISSNTSYPKLFFFRKHSNDGSSDGYYGNSVHCQTNDMNKIDIGESYINTKLPLTQTEKGNNQFLFTNTNNTSTGNVTFWIEENAEDNFVFYFTTDENLSVSHSLYSTASKYSGSPDFCNGTGVPDISVKLLDNEGNTLLKRSGKNGELDITEAELRTDGAAYLEVTLSNTVNDDNSVVDIYRDTGSTFNSIDTEKSKAVSYNISKDTTTVVYKYNISDFLNENTLNTHQLNFYSDYKTDVLEINFKYYYHTPTANGASNSIDETATTATVKASAFLNKTSSVENAILNALNNGDMNFQNVIDKYYFWTSQYEAEKGIEDFDNYHKSTENGYSKYKDSGYTDAQMSCHLDCYGNPLSGNDLNDIGNKWVSYTRTNGTQVVYKANENDSEPVDYSLIKSVTVWGYNAPILFNVELYMPTDDNSNMKSIKSNIYSVSSSTPTKFYQSLYNQRLGTVYTNASENSITKYLYKRGFTSSGLGDYTPPESTFTSNNETYTFDGWYAREGLDTYTKVSTELYYQSRITSNIVLVAGYVKGTEVSSDIGVSVTNSGVDTYYDSNNVKKVSLNTLVNVFNASEKDNKIKKIAAIYLQLPVTDANGKTIYWTQTMINSLGLDKSGTMGEEIDKYLKTLSNSEDAAIKGNGTLSISIQDVEVQNCKVISYNYNTSWTDSSDSSTAVLTNKNRVEFTLPMRADYYEGGSNSAIVAYAAVYYDGKGWILSENYVPYIYNLVAENVSTEDVEVEEEITGIFIDAE